MLRMMLSDPVNSLYVLLVGVMLAEALWLRGRRHSPAGRDARAGRRPRLFGRLRGLARSARGAPGGRISAFRRRTSPGR